MRLIVKRSLAVLVLNKYKKEVDDMFKKESCCEFLVKVIYGAGSEVT